MRGDLFIEVCQYLSEVLYAIPAQITAQEMEEKYPSQLGSLLRCGTQT